MPVNLTYSNPAPGIAMVEVELYDLTVGEMLTLQFQAGVATMTHEVTSALAAIEVSLLLTEIEAFVFSQGADGFWETVSTESPSAVLEVQYSDAIGDLVITSDMEGGGPDVATKIWRGDAPAVAQVVRCTPGSVEAGDTFALNINGKLVSFTATDSTPENVCAGLAAAIGASELPEFQEITASSSDGVLTLTANESGKPFEVSSATTDGGEITLIVSTVEQGAAAANCVQRFAVPLSCVGSFAVVFGDQATAGLAIGASAATVQTALEGLSTIGSGNVSVGKSSDSNDDTYTVTFQGSLAQTAVAQLIVTITSTKPAIRTTQQGSPTGTVRNEIQTIDLGSLGSGYAGTTLTLTLDGQTTVPIDLESTGATFEAALENLSNVVGITATRAGNVVTVEFTGIDGSANQSQLTSSVFSGSLSTTIYPTVEIATPGGGGAEQQQISFSSTPAGGTFTLSFNGQTSATIAHNAAAATVETALEALSSIGSGNVSVSGSAGGPWTVTFTGTLATGNQPAITGDGTNLTNSTGQTLNVTTATASSGPHHWDTAANWLPSGVPANGDHVRFESGSSDCLYGLAQSAVTLASLHCAARWTGKLGLPRQNSSGYLEFRPFELSIGATSILIGHGEGSGSGKIAINTGAVQTAIEVRSSGGSSDSGLPAITWRGTHAANTVTILGGDFGTAPYSDQSAVIDVLTQRGGTVSINHTALSELYAAGQNLSAYDCTLGGAPLEL